jgi:hypothetical protein
MFGMDAEFELILSLKVFFYPSGLASSGKSMGIS